MIRELTLIRNIMVQFILHFFKEFKVVLPVKLYRRALICESSLIRCMGTLPCFPAIFSKGDNFCDFLFASGHFHIKLEVQKMQFLGLISSQNKIYCSILHLHSKHMVVFYKW